MHRIDGTLGSECFGIHGAAVVVHMNVHQLSIKTILSAESFFRQVHGLHDSLTPLISFFDFLNALLYHFLTFLSKYGDLSLCLDGPCSELDTEDRLRPKIRTGMEEFWTHPVWEGYMTHRESG